jgi:hypothetical protein
VFLADGPPSVSPVAGLVIGFLMAAGFGYLATVCWDVRRPGDRWLERAYLNWQLTGALFFALCGVLVLVDGLVRVAL